MLIGKVSLGNILFIRQLMAEIGVGLGSGGVGVQNCFLNVTFVCHTGDEV